MRVFASSLGTDPGRLTAGRDLVLDLDIAHGDRLPEGVYFHDLLDTGERRRIDELTVEAVAAWREHADPVMTADGVCWPWILEWDLHRRFFESAHRALGLRRAVERHRPDELVLMHADPATRALAEAVGAAVGIPVRTDAGAPPAPAPVDPPPPVARIRRARRRLLSAARRVGLPSRLRPGSVLFHSYWPLEPLLDRMIADPAWRPAVCLQKLPLGRERWTAAARQGGFMGLPTFRDVARARTQARRLADAAAGLPFAVDGLDLTGPFGQEVQRIVADRVAVLADAPMIRRALRAGHVRHVLGAYDSDPPARLMIALAREQGVPTLCLCHGAYCLPQTLADLDVCDQAAIWTEAVAPRMDPRGRPVHVVGYPAPVQPAPVRRLPTPVRAPRVVVFGQYAVSHTATLDKRMTARTWRVAVEAVRSALPGAQIVLRPHPFERFATDSPLAPRFGGDDVVVDRTTPIGPLLQGADLAIGGTSTATFQTALEGCPAIVLNLSPFDWAWPLGGGTEVPVARSAAELAPVLERFRDEGTLPGAGDLLDALGVGAGDPVAALLEIVSGQQGARRASAAPSSSSTG